MIIEWVRDNISMRDKGIVNAIDRLSDVRDGFLSENLTVRVRSPKHFEIVINVPLGHEEEGQAILDAIVDDYLDFHENEVYRIIEKKIKICQNEMGLCAEKLEQLYVQRMSVIAQREELAQVAERETDSEVELWFLENEIEFEKRRFQSLHEEVTQLKYRRLNPNAITYYSLGK